jgi:hypothetical protein
MTVSLKESLKNQTGKTGNSPTRPTLFFGREIAPRRGGLFLESNYTEAIMLNKLLITTAASGLMLSAAWAQAPSPPAGSEGQASPPAATQGAGQADKPNVISQQKPDQWLASKFRGTDVVGEDNQKIGDVSDILFDKSGKIEAYVISVGGFLGMGSKEVALPPASFQVVKGDQNAEDKLKVSMNKDQLQQAANFEKYSPPRPAATTGTGPGAGGGTRPGGGGGMAPQPR